MEVLKSKYLISPIHYEGLQRIEPLEIPEGALREMIFNSIIHKDYTGVHIQMKVYADRLELWNDGVLPDGYTVDTLLGDHASKPRNKNIAAVFYRAGFIESWGRGIRKICEGFESNNLPKPEFESHCGGVRVTVMRPNEKTGLKTGLKTSLKTGLKTDMGELTLKMKDLIDENPSVSIDKLAITMGLSRNGVKYHLNTLKEKMGLIRVGGRKNGHWEFHED
jgi:ATP-dependent DNA helicase RecG